MRTKYALLSAVILASACASPPEPVPPSNVGTGQAASAANVSAYTCSLADEQVCECERAAIASGLDSASARAACAP